MRLLVSMSVLVWLISMGEGEASWAFSKIMKDAAHRIAPCSLSATVAVIDTGLSDRFPHREIRTFPQPAWEGWSETTAGYGLDFVDRDFYPNDADGHGTKVAGMIASPYGYCPEARILPIRIGESRDELSFLRAVQALQYLREHHQELGVKVIHLSFGEELPFAIRTVEDLGFLLADLASKGLLTVTSAGNFGCDIDEFPNYFFPASFPDDGQIAVGASDEDDRRWFRSNHSKQHVDLFAPGVALPTFPLSGVSTNESGTSLSAPFVSGLALSYLHLKPQASPQLMRRWTIVGCDVYGSDSSLAGSVCQGRLNAYRSLMIALWRKDLDANGYADLLLEGTSPRDLRVWSINHRLEIRDEDPLPLPYRSMERTVGLGDFLRKGSSQILSYEEQSGALRVWIMNGFARERLQSVAFRIPSEDDRLIGVTDFNNDRELELVLQNRKSARITTVDRWQAGSPVLKAWLSPTDPRWRLAHVQDLNGDAHRDFIFQRAGSGELEV